MRIHYIFLVNHLLKNGGHMEIREGRTMLLNLNLSNRSCIRKHFTALPDLCSDYCDVYDVTGKIQYMQGETLELMGYDEKKQTVTLWNENNDRGKEEITIPYSQFKRDFGLWQLPHEILKNNG